MSTYEIKLPGAIIKFRVKEEKDGWTILKVAVDDPSVVGFLKSIAVGDEIIKKEKPAEKEEPTPSKPAEDTSTKIPLTDEQKQKMRKLCDHMKLKSKDELNTFILDWSYGQGKTWKYLHGGNVDGFISYMKDEILTEDTEL